MCAGWIWPWGGRSRESVNTMVEEYNPDTAEVKAARMARKGGVLEETVQSKPALLRLL